MIWISVPQRPVCERLGPLPVLPLGDGGAFTRQSLVEGCVPLKGILGSCLLSLIWLPGHYEVSSSLYHPLPPISSLATVPKAVCQPSMD
jgi:hypothetical protein